MPKIDEKDFIEVYREKGPTRTAAHFGISVRYAHTLRREIEAKLEFRITGKDQRLKENRIYNPQYPTRLEENFSDGRILIGSDAHYWPGEPSAAHKLFVKFAKTIQPELIILNGDVLDGASISRHPPIRWEHKPTLKDELAAVEERLNEIEAAAPKARLYWLIGNHCSRFETRLATSASEFSGIPGFRLSDHFLKWKFGLSLWINNDTVVKHRFKGGVHATHNNTLLAGKSIVTGHLHSGKVTPFSDYNGTRYGVDTGTLSDAYGEHASYDEDNPKNHRSAFVLLTYTKNKLLYPELVLVDEGQADFRGQLISPD